MPRAVVATGMELAYETLGHPADPPVLLVVGFGAQLTLWPESLCHALADGGRFVIRFDNRDCGLSSKLHGVDVDVNAVLMAALMDDPIPPVPYTLSDMALDAVGLLDVLGIDRAHVVGQSMGGMIAQHMAIEHPRRLRTLTSIMSTTGEPEYGQSAPEAIEALLDPVPEDREGYIVASDRYMVYKSKRHADRDAHRAQAARDFDRGLYLEGQPRQLAAVYASGRRTETLPTVTAPTLVIHGLDDLLITPSGGRRTAELVPGAELLEVADMGHDFPEPLVGLLAEAILSHSAKEN